jgi:hypothetical protein
LEENGQNYVFLAKRIYDKTVGSYHMETYDLNRYRLGLQRSSKLYTPSRIFNPRGQSRFADQQLTLKGASHPEEFGKGVKEHDGLMYSRDNTSIYYTSIAMRKSKHLKRMRARNSWA